MTSSTSVQAGVSSPVQAGVSPRQLLAVGLISATLLMTELALTRIFSVVMYYHFAFLAISIALFGLSASGVFAYVARRRLERYDTGTLLAVESVVYALFTLVALLALVRMRIGLVYSRQNLILMLTTYALAALPFFTGGLVLTLAISRMSGRINAVYASDLIGAAAGCLVLIPLLDRVGAPGVVLTAAALALTAGVLFASRASRLRFAIVGGTIMAVALAGQWSGVAVFDVGEAKGHVGDQVLFTKWNSFSRIGVYERTHDNWSLSPTFTGTVPHTRYMDIDAAASTPILQVTPDLSNVQYLKYELTAVAYRLKPPGFSALVIGPGGGRDLVSALVFGAGHVDGVEINPIIANDVMRDKFREFSGGIYTHPRVRIAVDDGRSFVRGSPDRYDIIQASLVDTWAATAAGAYTLTENTLYTVEAFNDYLDHLTDDGIVTMTRWVIDGLRLVSLAQEAGAARGWDVSKHLAVVQYDRVQTFLLKKSEFTPAEIATLAAASRQLEFNVIYAPTFAGEATPPLPTDWVDGMETADYPRLIRAADRQSFYDGYKQDIRPTTDDRPFFFHTTKLADQFQVAFGRAMLFGNGLSALLTLMGISTALVVLFVLGPLAFAGGADAPRWFAWLVYFGALGAGFMLIEVSILQRFVLLLGHPVYSLTVTLFSLLLGTGIGAAWSRRLRDATLVRSTAIMLVAIAVISIAVIAVVTPLVMWAIPFARSTRIGIAVATLLPIGIALGIPMPAGIRLLSARAPQMVTWAWGINGALSVVGATLAIFIAMNWGFGVTLVGASAVYLIGLAALISAV
jgi:spermidine synthase